MGNLVQYALTRFCQFILTVDYCTKQGSKFRKLLVEIEQHIYLMVGKISVKKQTHAEGKIQFFRRQHVGYAANHTN